jgi:hypothetical protein
MLRRCLMSDNIARHKTARGIDVIGPCPLSGWRQSGRFMHGLGTLRGTVVAMLCSETHESPKPDLGNRLR